MRLKSHQQQQQQQQQSTNQRLITHVAIIIILVVVGSCLLATTVVATESTSHPEAIQIGDPKQRIPRQVVEDNKARDDCDTLDGASYHKPHFAKGRSVIVELFEWKFVDVAEECRTFLGPKGYGGVQLSPVLEHTVIKTDKLQHPWWQRFETVSYRFASLSGDESEFWSMSRICNDNGVRIYLDVLFNHMAAPLHQLLNETTDSADFNVNTLLESNVNIFNLSYPNVPYTSKHFHRPCAIGNSQNAHEIRNCQLNGHPDLDLGLPSVQKHIVDMLNKFIDMGVAGFHVYGAKYMWPNDLKNIYDQLKDLNKDFNFANNSRPFMYHDIFDIGLDSISKTEYATYGAVTEYLYAAEISTILRGKAPLSSLINWGPAMGFLSHQDSVIFVDSPETQRGLPHELGKNRVITYRNPQKYTMANAMMMAHPYGGIKRIMSSYYFSEKNIDQGPPTEEGDGVIIRSPELNEQQQCTVASGWVCEHRWPMMVNLVALSNYFSVPGQQEESVIHFQTNGPNHIAFCRGHKAFVAMNNDAENDFIKDVFTCLEPGVYCDVITGGLKDGGKECHGRRLEVNEIGYAKLNLLVADDNELQEVEDQNIVANFGVLVVYAGSKIGSEVGKVWEESTDGNDNPIEKKNDFDSPGIKVVNHLSGEKEDSAADGQMPATDEGNEGEGGEEDTPHDGADGNPELPANRHITPEVQEYHTEIDISKEIVEHEDGEMENNKEDSLPNTEDSKDQDIVEEEEETKSLADNFDAADLSGGENDEAAAAVEEKGDGEGEEGQEAVNDNEDNRDNEKSEVPEAEFTENEEKVDEIEENVEDDGDSTKEEKENGDQDTFPDENQESAKDVGESMNEEEQDEDGNSEASNGGEGNDNDADTDGDEKAVDEDVDETPEGSNTNEDSDIPDEGEHLAAPINDEQESDVTEVSDFDIDPGAPIASQENGENIGKPFEEVAHSDTAQNKDSNSHEDAKDSDTMEGSEETGDQANDLASSEPKGEVAHKAKEEEENNDTTNEPNVQGKDDETEAENLQIEKPFLMPTESADNSNITLEITDGEEAVKNLLDKSNATIYEIVDNITERLPFSGNNSKAAVKVDEVLTGAIFPASRTQQSNGDQMIKSHSFLLWLIVIKMLAFDFDLGENTI